MCNVEIRAKAKEKNVKLWEIAEKIGLNDGNFSRKLRRELTETDSRSILAVIDEIASAKQKAARNEQTKEN